MLNTASLPSRRSGGGTPVPIPRHDAPPLGAPAEPEADRLSELARLLFGAPEMLVRLIEAQGGTDAQDKAPLVPSAPADALSTDGPQGALRPHFCHDAAVPLHARDGGRIGTLLVASPRPRPGWMAGEHRGRLEALAGVAADALEARLRLRLAAEALAEKDLFAREADHRVANGLQLVHGALSLQAAAEPCPASRAALQGAAHRIAAVAGAHRHLHNAPGTPADSVAPNAADYLAALVRDLAPGAAGGTAASRPVVLHAAPGAAAAVPAGLLPRLGLIVAELVANAQKHGTGRVLVELRPASSADGGGVALVVSDEGPGFPVGFDPEARGRKGLGMRLVAALSRPGGVRIDPEDRRRIVVRLVDHAQPGAPR